jgi:hypothetical protein
LTLPALLLLLLLLQGGMWQDRLVAKLLQERQKGQASGWYPYLQVWF